MVSRRGVAGLDFDNRVRSLINTFGLVSVHVQCYFIISDLCLRDSSHQVLVLFLPSVSTPSIFLLPFLR